MSLKDKCRQTSATERSYIRPSKIWIVAAQSIWAMNIKSWKLEWFVKFQPFWILLFISSWTSRFLVIGEWLHQNANQALLLRKTVRVWTGWVSLRSRAIVKLLIINRAFNKNKSQHQTEYHYIPSLFFTGTVSLFWKSRLTRKLKSPLWLKPSIRECAIK